MMLPEKVELKVWLSADGFVELVVRDERLSILPSTFYAWLVKELERLEK